MNPCYNLVDIGRDYAHFTNIYPFRDRPDVPVRVLFWPIPRTRDPVPFANPFVLRNWDILNEEDVPDLGTKYDAKERYFGPLPVNAPGDPCGTADQWANGCLYSEWIADLYTCDCPEVVFVVAVNSVTNIDGSLIFSPITGNVVGSINPGHTNAWSVIQHFYAGDPTLPAAAFQAAIGQTGNIVEVVDPSAALLAGVDPLGQVFSTHSLQVGANPGLNGLLNINDPAGVAIFSISPSGQIATNQVVASSVSNIYSGQLPLYDPTGAIVGYVPVQGFGTPPGLQSVADSFTGPNGTPLDGRIPDIADSAGGVWCSERGTWQLNGGNAVVVASTGIWDMCIIEHGSANGTITVDVVNDAVNGWGCVMRCNSCQSGLSAGVLAVGQLLIWRQDAGNFYQLGSVAYAITGGPATLIVVMNDETITATVGGSTVTVRAASYLHETVHGLWTFQGNAAFSRWKYVNV